MTSPNGSPVFVELGQRPDEAGPPIGGEAAYPADVTARLETSARDIIARYPLLHDASGVSLTFSSGFDGGTSDDTPYSLYGKLGWDTRFTPFGPTGFGIDYMWNENLSNEGNEGQSAGFSAVQVFED